METRTPKNSTKAKEVPVIPLVPPVIFLRKRKRMLPIRIVRRLVVQLFPRQKLKRREKNRLYAQSKRVYIN